MTFAVRNIIFNSKFSRHISIICNRLDHFVCDTTQVCLGDTIVVDVENGMMEESTSIHWHGHHQRNSPYMDGVPYVTQCPVPPHSSFRYVYEADNVGTHFWHSHSGCQRGDGVFGSFVVRAPKERDVHRDMYDVDVHVLTVTDWLHELGIRKFLAHYHGSGNNKPETILINGRGRYRVFNDGSRTPLARFSVTRVSATSTPEYPNISEMSEKWSKFRLNFNRGCIFPLLVIGEISTVQPRYRWTDKYFLIIAKTRWWIV